MSLIDRAKLLRDRGRIDCINCGGEIGKADEHCRWCRSIPSLLDVARLARALDPLDTIEPPAVYRTAARQGALQCAACGAALPEGETISCSQCGATLAITSLADAHAEVQALAPALRAAAARPSPRRRQAPPRRARRGPAAPARVGRRRWRPRPTRGAATAASTTTSSGRSLLRWTTRARRPRGRVRGLDRMERWPALKLALRGWRRRARRSAGPARARLLAWTARVIGTLCALGAIALWATLASLGVALAHVPPFLLTGLRARRRQRAVVAAVAPVARADVDAAARRLRPVRLPLPALRRPAHAPPLEANLVNYLWPLLIVVLAPVVPARHRAAAGARARRGRRLRRRGAGDRRRSRAVSGGLSLGLPRRRRRRPSSGPATRC